MGSKKKHRNKKIRKGEYAARQKETTTSFRKEGD